MRSQLVAIVLTSLLFMSVQQQGLTSTTESSNATDITTTANPVPGEETTTVSNNITSTANTASKTTMTGNTAATADSTSNTTIASSTPATAAPTSPLSRPVSQQCQNQYTDCVQQQIKDWNYCEAFTASASCINRTSNQQCSNEELFLLKFLDCEPVTFFNQSINDKCAGQVTVCLSGNPDATKIDKTSDFKTLFCKAANETCLKTTCTQVEYQAARKMAACSSAASLVSSALFIFLSLVVMRIQKEC